MTDKLEEWKALAKLENKRARQKWGVFRNEREVLPKSKQPVAQVLSLEAEKVNLMLDLGYTKKHIAKQLKITINRVGKIVTSYSLPKK